MRTLIITGGLLLGVLIASFFRFSDDKDKYDKRGNTNFPYRKYILLNWDNWLRNLLGGVLVLVAAPAVYYIWTWYEHGEGLLFVLPDALWLGYAMACGWGGAFIVDKLRKRISRIEKL